MSLKNSVGNTKPVATAQRALLDRRQRPADAAPVAPATGSAAPEKTGPSNSAPAVLPDQSNLRSPTESNGDLPVSTEFLDETAFDAFVAERDRTSAEQTTDQVPVQRAKSGRKDSPARADDTGFKLENPTLGTGVTPVTLHVPDGDTYKLYPMGMSAHHMVPGHLIEPDATKEISVQELLMPTPTPGTAPLPGGAANTPPVHPAVSGPVPTVPQQPDTSNDAKIALQEQIKETTADIAFFADIENRLKVILDKYKDPKGEVKKLHAETQDYVQALALQCNEYKAAYQLRHTPLADPLNGSVEDLARQGQGQPPARTTPERPRAEPRRPERREPPQRAQRKEPLGALRQRFQDGLNAESDADSSGEGDDGTRLSRHSQTAKHIVRRTTELEASYANSDESEDSTADPIHRPGDESMAESSEHSLDDLIRQLQDDGSA